MQRVLAIDDDDNRDAVSLTPEQEGFRTMLAAEGRSGFEQILTVQGAGYRFLP